MKIGDWDWMVAVGILALVAGLWVMWGPGAALLGVGVMLILAGIGGALNKTPNEA